MKMDESCQILSEQFNQLVSVYPDLEFNFDKVKNCFFVAGVLSFSASFGDRTIHDSYLIRIDIPHKFDAFHAPSAYELAGRIPQTFHHYLDGSLCLGIYIAVYEKLNQNCTLLGYVENLLIPYLFAYSCYEKNGNMPFGVAEHDDEALLVFLKERFSDIPTERFLDFLIYMYMPQVYGSHRPCLCGSDLPMRNCHFSSIRLLTDLYQKRVLRREIHDCVYCLLQQNNAYDSMISRKNRARFMRELRRDNEADKRDLDMIYGKALS
ncbi:MAG: hypothetical protein IJS14_04010 [Lentisphaeria bacterium]|nr:hypothetical protein [Lentisphaeria bacterium]